MEDLGGAEEIIVTGPGAPLLQLALNDPLWLTVDPGCRRGWAEWVGGLAIEQFESDGYDPTDQGPDYIRGSDAQLARIAKS